MELRHFRYFIAVARHLHFGRAAAHLNIAPSTLTRQIQDIETELGIRLFDRNQRTVALTSAGRVLLEEAQQAVTQFEVAQRRAQREARGETGDIHLGYVASAAFSGVLQRQVARFRAACPDVRLSVHEAAMHQLPAQVSDGQIDIACIRSPMTMPDSVEELALAPDPFVLALPTDSWLARLPTLTPAHLVDETFILPEQISGTLAVAAAGGFTPRMGAQPGGLIAVLARVSLGDGVAVVPASVTHPVHLPGVTYRPLPTVPDTSHLSLVYRRHDPSAAVRRYIQLTRSDTHAT